MTIKVSKLFFSYESGAAALENTSLSIDEGDFVALIGTNGSGKTTLVKLLLGILKPTKGKIELFGEDISVFNNWEKIGYVPQKYSIDRNFPASVNEILGLKGVRNELIIKKLGITNVLNKKFSQLSGGQQQRVLIALCLMKNPKLLILDEPTVGVDINAQKEFYKVLKKLNQEEKITIILVTHDIGMISHQVKKVICLNGKICKQGKPADAEKLINEVYGEHFHVHKH